MRFIASLLVRRVTRRGPQAAAAASPTGPTGNNWWQHCCCSCRSRSTCPSSWRPHRSLSDCSGLLLMAKASAFNWPPQPYRERMRSKTQVSRGSRCSAARGAWRGGGKNCNESSRSCSRKHARGAGRRRRARSVCGAWPAVSKGQQPVRGWPRPPPRAYSKPARARWLLRGVLLVN